MPTYAPDTAQCRVFSFKEGLLSAIAHDLEMTVESFEIAIADDGSEVTAWFDLLSLRVVDAVVNDALSPGALSAKDKRKIEKSLHDDVLRVRRHPRAEFRSSRLEETADGWRLEGTLSLSGSSRPIRVSTRRVDDWAQAEVTIHQPDFGIKPFRAMMGTLKVAPDVRVRIRVPFPSR